MTKKRKDTSISLQPLTFEEAIRELARSSKHEGSQVEESCNTNEDVPESETSVKRNAPHPESSGD